MRRRLADTGHDSAVAVFGAFHDDGFSERKLARSAASSSAKIPEGATTVVRTISSSSARLSIRDTVAWEIRKCAAMSAWRWPSM